MNPFRRSLRRRVAVTLAVTCVVSIALGYVALNAARDDFFRLFGSFSHPHGRECFFHLRPSNVAHAFTFSGATCYPPFTTAQHLWILAAFVALLVLLGWLWWVLAGRAMQPLAQTVQTVRQLGPQNLRQRIRMNGSADVLKELADALDGALDRLAAGYEGQRRFASNASHELRTPLAVQRLLTEVALDDPGAGEDLRRLGAQLLRTNERSERLIEGLLVLAESDRGLPGKVPVRLHELAASVLDAHLELASKHGVSLHRSLAERLVPGDPVLLERLISNLVTNAISYNQPGGWVEVEVAAETGSGPALAVRNTGQHVPPEAVTLLFEPFRRLTADRTNHSGGTGLGMSIVRSITTAHSGTVRARPRSEGGLIVEIDLPAEP